MLNFARREKLGKTNVRKSYFLNFRAMIFSCDPEVVPEERNIRDQGCFAVVTSSLGLRSEPTDSTVESQYAVELGKL